MAFSDYILSMNLSLIRIFPGWISKSLLGLLLWCCLLSLRVDAQKVDGPENARTVAVRTDNVKGDFPAAAAWTNAHAAKPFPVLGDTGKNRSNEARVLYDEKALYVRVRVSDPAIKKHSPKKEGQPGFSGVWNNDCVELFLGSATDPAAKVHFIVDVLGQRYQDLAMTWRSKVERDAEGYAVLIAVPFDSLDWQSHNRGDALKIKFGHESKTGLGNSMWPVNFSSSLLAEDAWGLLYFDSENIMPDGGFEETAGSGKSTHGAWRFIAGNKETGDAGTMEVVKSPLPDGGRAVRINKTNATPWWYPYISLARLELQKGQGYIVSAWVQSEKPWVFRCYFYKKGEAKHISSLKIQKEASPDAMRYFEAPFVMPEEADSFNAGFVFAQAETGSMVIDNVALRIDPFGAGQVHVGAKDGVSHPVHGLLELAERGRIPPAHMSKADVKRYPCERVVFKDTATGATLWKMTRWPGNSQHQYANMLCWNANASLLKIISSRARNLLLTSDGREMFKLDVPDADNIDKWCPVNPARLYVAEYRGDKHDKKVFYIYDVYRNEKRYLPGEYPRQGTTLWVPHPDGKRIIIVENSLSRTAETSIGHFINPDTGEMFTFDFKGVTHQVWFTERKDYSIYFGYESANKYYTADRDGAWLINPDGTNLRKVYHIYWVHGNSSPDGERVAFHCSSGIRIVNVIDGGNDEQVSSHAGGHVTWQVTPEWFITSASGKLRCMGAQGQGFDYVLCHSRFQSPFGHANVMERPDSSPDGTKVAYSSTMMGDFDFYNAITRLPHPPQGVEASVDGSVVRLKWSPPRYHRETKGYFVYRSFESGGDYCQLNVEPVQETTFTDKLPPGKSHAFYLVTAVERCGLEGRFSGEICASSAGTWQGFARFYFEMEDAIPVKPLMEHFDSDASGMYVMRMDRAEGGKAKMRIAVPAAGKYTLWLRAGSIKDAGQVLVSFKEQRLTVDQLAAKGYQWFKVGVLDLPGGESELDFEVQGKQLRLDALFVTDDSKAVPRNNLLWDNTPPANPQGLRAECGESYVQLGWNPVSDMDVAYYNVYASRKPDFEISQKRLIASPLDPQYTDWGIKRGVTYYYKVCAVDRRGNISQPSKELDAQTEDDGEVVLIRKQVGDARKGLPSGESKARKQLEAMGAFAEKAHEVAKSNPLSVEFDVPSDGNYVVWVKYALTRKEGEPAIKIAAGSERAVVGGALKFISSERGAVINNGVFIWEAGQQGSRTQVFKLKQGKVKFAFHVDADSQFEIAEVVLTNDLGFQPKGIHCYRPGNPTWMEID